MARCAEFSAAPLLQCANNFVPLSLQWINRMATIHDEIDNWLAADLYGELSENERSVLHAHLVDCVICRKTHQETKTMNKILEETLAQEKPDPAFEQRMLAAFRNRIPQRNGLVKSLVDLMRLRPVQITAVAAILLALVQMGRVITGERAAMPRSRGGYANEELGLGRAGSLDKSDELAAGRPKDLALQAPPPSSETESKLHKEVKTFPTTVAPAKVAQPEASAAGAFATSPENLARAEVAEQKPAETPAPASANRKLIRNASVELEIVSFDDAVQKITAFASEERGYVATTDSQ